MPASAVRLLGFAEMAEAAEVMVAVALDMLDAEQRHRGEIRLQRHDRQIGQVLGREEQLRPPARALCSAASARLCSDL